MRRVHLYLAALAFAAFLGTGYHMRTLFTETWAGGDAQRFMHRSAHIYILFSALMNAMAGLLYRPFQGWRKAVQALTSIALLVVPFLFVLAFFVEQPAEGRKRPYVLPAVALCLVSVGALTTVHCLPNHSES